MRILALILLALALSAGAGRAQVAAPALNPFEQDNPAVLPFTGSSVLGVGVAQGEIESGGGTTDFDVAGGTVRVVGETFAGAASTAHGTAENDIAELESDETIVQLAAGLGPLLGVGIVAGRGTDTVTFKATGLSDETEFERRAGGVTLRLAEVFYISAAAGTENVQTTTDLDTFDAPVPLDVDADIRVYGIGYSRRDGASGFHAEVYRDKRAGPELQVSGTVIGFPAVSDLDEEAETDGAVLEVLFGNVLLGVRVEDEEETRLGRVQIPSFPLVINEKAVTTEEERTIVVGLVPEEGITVVLSHAVEETEERIENDVLGDSVSTSEDTTTAVTVGWLF